MSLISRMGSYAREAFQRLVGVAEQEDPYRTPDEPAAPDTEATVDADGTAVTRQEKLETFIASQPEYEALREPEQYPPTLMKLEEQFDGKEPKRVGFRQAFKTKWIGGRHG